MASVTSELEDMVRKMEVSTSLMVILYSLSSPFC